ncbi:transcription factor DIVARICATA-like [Vicia villosa]|uniref:transcription factor DIVARICATA-like n=1 Tax=Vicia villosa TaxID=3911 RepID=UPI00273CADE3|nr:transcription factor DIVARICATA-like [Vicia villosa]
MMKCEMGILSSHAPFVETNWFLEDRSYNINRRATKWTASENKLFENALAVYDKDTPDRWAKVAEMIPGKSVVDVMNQYKELEVDVCNIEAGLVPIPGYSTSTSTASPFTLDWVSSSGYDGFRGINSKRSGSGRSPDQERKKGVPWTEEEHKLFLLGLKKYGKGDWRNISRNFVITRTPTQVASHAQKYFIRQLSGGKDKRRASIHDITTVNLTETSKASPTSENTKTSTSPHNHSQSMNIINKYSTANTASEMHFQPAMITAFNPSHEQVFMSPYGVNMNRNPLHESSYFGTQTQNMVFQMQPSQQQNYSHA